MRLTLILLASSFITMGFSSCPTDISEPNISPCGLFPPKVINGEYYFVCTPFNKPSYELSLDQAMQNGFIGLTVPEYAEGKKHHSYLHTEIDFCD